MKAARNGAKGGLAVAKRSLESITTARVDMGVTLAAARPARKIGRDVIVIGSGVEAAVGSPVCRISRPNAAALTKPCSKR